MARRLFNGRAFSEDGWPYVDEGSCTWITVLGTNPPVRLQIQNGPPVQIMGPVAADFNAYVEPLRDPDSACWTPGNSVATSNHPGGTAMDLNWDTHRFQVSGTFNAAQQRTIAEIVDFYEGMIGWAGPGYWSGGPVDEMHWQMGYDTYDQKADQPFPKVFDFLNRKIRADGFSTFRRDGAPVVLPPMNPPAVDVLMRATGISTSKAADILPQVSFALVKANCTNPRRIAAALAQWVIESGHFVYTEEIASGPESEERWKYKGRTWVQLTWLENYRGFSVWCHSLGLVPTPDYFVVHPRELADQKWAALGPAYWWAVKYPRINEYADRGDIDNVSKWVNAPAWVDQPNKHANGESERRDAYNQALALGDQLLVLTTDTPPTPPTSGEDMAAVPQDEWARVVVQLDRVFHEVADLRESRSPVREPDERAKDTWSGFGLNTDGSQHLEVCKVLAGYGHPPTIALLKRVAAMPVDKPGREGDCLIAQAILADVTSAPVAAVSASFPGPVPAAPLPVAPQIVYVDRPTAAPALVEQTSNGQESTGQIIGAAYDALQKLRLADALPIEDRAPLAALISVLSTKNGASL